MTVASEPADTAGTADTDLRLLARSLPDIAWMSAPDGSVVYLNERARAYQGPEGAGWDWARLVHPDDIDRARSAWDAARRTTSPYDYECRIRAVGAEYRWHRVRGVPIPDGTGAVRRWVGTATDVDESRRREAELRGATAELGVTLTLLEELQSKAPIGLGFVDRDFRVVRVNEVLAALVGATADALIGETVERAFPDVWRRTESFYRAVLDTGEAVVDIEVDRPAVSVGGASEQRWLTSYYPLVLDGGVAGVGVVVVDVTDRVEGEATRRLLAAIVESSADAIIGVTVEGVVTSWNGAAERLFGYTAAEIIGVPISVLAPSGRRSEQAALRSLLLAGASFERVETIRRRKDGTMVEVLVTASTVTDADGSIVGLSVIAHDITRRRTEQRALEAGERRLAEAQRVAKLGSFEYDVGVDELRWSAECARILGVDPAVTPTVALFTSLVDRADARVVSRLWRDAAGRGRPFDDELRVTGGAGTTRFIRVRAVPELADDGTVLKVAGTLSDETDRTAAERERKAAETRFEIGFEQTGIGASILDLDGIPTRVNAAVCSILGRSERELVGVRWTEYSHEEGVPLEDAVLARVAAGHDTYADDRRFRRPDGTVVWTSLTITLVRDDRGEPQYYLAQLQDITERKEMERALAHQAMHDSLTGLPNRALLTDRLRQGLAGTRRRGSQIGVVLVDVDHLKLVNDSYGHATGDRLLRTVGERITAILRPGDTVGRLESDEFVIVCADVTAREVEQIAERVLEAIRRPWTIDQDDMVVTASLGIAIGEGGESPESLLRDADTAMYRAKERGRARSELFDDALRSKSARRLATSSAIRYALDRREFAVHYQPVVDLVTGGLAGVEALLRWQQPGRGLVYPGDFVPIAEESGLIVPIGAWLLEQACNDAVEWRRIRAAAPPSRGRGQGDAVSMAVNLSVHQVLAPDIVELVAGVLRRTGLPPGDLCLEVTESVFIEDVEHFERTLAGLKDLGLSLAIDDFGTGYSSLSYLRRFPVDAVKVDQSFVGGLGSNSNDTALVTAVVAMARALGLDVVAEGVETRRQLAELKRLEVPRAQGYLLGRAMPAAAIAQLVRASHRWRVD